MLEGPSEAERKRSRIFPFDGASTRDLLRKAPPAAFPLDFSQTPIDTVRVLLVRVSFLGDRLPSLSSISTGGDFDVSTDDGGLVDPTPHDKDYFDAHMTGLRNYFYYQSCGRLEVVWDIVPEGLEESYKLSDIADYGPGTAETWTVERLVRFFRDAIETADQELASQGYPIRFGDYDAVVLAHAGANLQSDVDYDTPNDIPSFFARLGDEDRFTVDGGETVIVDGSVVPETASQDGYFSGIAGVLFHEFGHQLGLPDLYNINSGFPAVGVWDLMDSGGMVGEYIEDEQGRIQFVEGFLPAGLSAWSKIFLGWAVVDTVMTFDSGIALPAVEKCPPRTVRVEASSDEYFLLENRAAELDDLPTLLVTDETGVITGVANCLNCQTGIPEVPEYELINGYDLLLPLESETLTSLSGPGIIIWHIDEGLIEERWDENTVNSLSPFGISVVEASGVIDLGDPYAYFWLGWYDDAFYSGNNSALSDSTLPASWSNWRAPTGVRIENISGRDTLMTFGAGVRALESTKMGFASDRVPANGLLPLEDPHDALVIDVLGDLWRAGEIEAPLASLGTAPMTPMAFTGDFDGMGAAVVIGGQDGSVHVVCTDDWSEPEGWPFETYSRLATHPVVMTTEAGCFVTVTDTGGRLRIVSSDGVESEGVSPIYLSDGERFLANIVVGSDTSGTARRLYAMSGGDMPAPHAWLAAWDIGVGPDDSLHLSSAGEYIRRIALTAEEMSGRIFMVGGDIVPGEPDDELYILCGSSGRVLLVGRRGLLSERDRERSIVNPPALIDLDGDSLLDLLYSDGHSVYAIAPSGANLSGWPKRLADLFPLTWEIVSSGSMTAAASSSGSLVLIGTDHGLLYALDGRGRRCAGFPRKISRALASSIDMLPHEDGALILYTDGGYTRWRVVPSRARIGAGGWTTVWSDYSRSAYASSSEGWVQTSDSWLRLADRFVIYPNPSTGTRVAFHFTAPDDGSASLEVMTLTGELVLETSKSVNGGEDEFIISMSDKASGIYLCRLVVTSGGRSVEAYKKFAIVR
jgi:M6 family metalloprotease-like protein